MVISTHLTDCAHGRAADGVRIRLYRQKHDGWDPVASSRTGADGRATDWRFDSEPHIVRGVYRLTFDTSAYFAELGLAAFHPEISVVFVVLDLMESYHVVLLVTPHSYVTYRGFG